ncbi:MAG: threonine/serine dehydratase [Gemmatimonadales bacterium]
MSDAGPVPTLEALTPECLAAARQRIAGRVVRTPLIRWYDATDDREVWLKLETLQPIGSFKLRGATSVLTSVAPEVLAGGVVTASAGNMAQGVAWGARELGVPCTVVVPDHAPVTKLKAIERLGGRVIRIGFDAWWRVLEDRRFEGAPGFFVHPVADTEVIAGNASIGFEIAEDLPEVDLVLVPFGGGGLSSGIAAALRQAAPAARVLAVEPETAAPFGASLAAGRPVSFDYQPSFIDGSGGKSVLPAMWPIARALLAGAVAVSPAEAADAVRLLAERARVVAEGAGALALAASRSEVSAGRRIVCIVSGGNIDAGRLAAILGGQVPR